MNNRRLKKQQGFTLIETLIALLIMGVSTAAMLVLIGQNTRFSADSEDRVIAAIVADNVMALTLANPVILDRGVELETIILGDRNWVAERIVQETSVDNLVNVTVRVRREGFEQVRSEVSTLKSEQR